MRDRETLLLLKMENEPPNFVLTDLSYIFALPFGNQEALKVAHAAGDDGDGTRAFTFGGSTKLITMKQSSYIGTRI